MKHKIYLKYRGAPSSDVDQATLLAEEKANLNLKAGRLIQGCLEIHGDITFTENTFDELRGRGYVGYAHYYLRKCYDFSELENKAVIENYIELLEIDAKLGTTQTEQLFGCVFESVRMDLIKVKVIFDLLD